MSDSKQYCGYVSERDGTYGRYLKVDLDLAELFTASKAGLGYQTKSGKEMLTVFISPKRSYQETGQPDQNGNTHTITIPNGNGKNQHQNGHNQHGSMAGKPVEQYTPPSQPRQDTYEDDIPF